jgi:hypothetical protein
MPRHHRIARGACLAGLALATGCLDPLVEDAPGASSHLLPSDAVVPGIAANVELANQLTLNDGLDDDTLRASGGVIPRGTGVSAGATVRYWSFGPAGRAPSPMYIFLAADGKPLDHPPLVDALPGDRGYSALHTLTHVQVTAAYKGERITTSEALADAIELGLVLEPVPQGQSVVSPVVLPGTMLDPGAAKPAAPTPVYVRGYEAAMFRFGGARGPQPGSELLPTNQVALLRAPDKATYDASRPVFQATIPTVPATTRVLYTPLSVVIDVDLKVAAASITQDSDLFVRDKGELTGVVTDNVAGLQITTTTLLLQLQFVEGEL